MMIDYIHLIISLLTMLIIGMISMFAGESFEIMFLKLIITFFVCYPFGIAIRKLIRKIETEAKIGPSNKNNGNTDMMTENDEEVGLDTGLE